MLRRVVVALDFNLQATFFQKLFQPSLGEVVGGQIEAARLGTKAAIDAASTTEEAQAAAAAVSWPDKN